ncbi:DUF2231 domain-containing protein [Nitratiruptor sp. YY09-18]|uniref:DUF2231 domain-containing protein n=1 Tax=Nitratiruptor sp. YY09-18 TaxID=2724901 RepID=UPI00191618DA|nr:DUF2231 domain-containing protein [Nitratiruptor sp. YY09-18]BCD67764.1 hypothetical protein NitYY0918_C0671 [Nitratiruptor sp. YY09-18]
MDALVQLLDAIKLPFALPIHLHPPIVHFAIALPVIALLLEISNIFLKRRCIGVISSLLLLLALFIYFAAFLTGKTDGKEAFSLLSEQGQAELKEHKLLGIYLVYGIGLVFILKLIISAINKMAAKIFFVVMLALFVGFVLKQGKDGGELVYTYGANVKAVSDMDDKIMDLEDEIYSCKQDLQKCQDELKKSQEAAPAKQESKAPAATSVPEEQAPQAPATTEQTPQAPAAKSPATNTEENGSNEQNNSSIEQKAQEVINQIKGSAQEVQQQVTIPTH